MGSPPCPALSYNCQSAMLITTLSSSELCVMLSLAALALQLGGLGRSVSVERMTDSSNKRSGIRRCISDMGIHLLPPPSDLGHVYCSHHPTSYSTRAQLCDIFVVVTHRVRGELTICIFSFQKCVREYKKREG